MRVAASMVASGCCLKELRFITPATQKLKLPRGASLCEAADIRHVRRHGRVVRGRCLRIQVVQDSKNAQSRLAVVTSRHVGLAVERNLARRQVREIFRAVRGDFSEAWMFVVTVQTAATRASFAELREEFLEHCCTLRVILDES